MGSSGGGSGPFGCDPEDLERVVREAGDGLRELVEGLSKFIDQPGKGGTWSGLFADFASGSRTSAKPETTGEAGDGVWAIFTIDEAGVAHAEQVYRTELEALRAHADDIDPSRRVRFLPYGVSISVLDQPSDE